MKSRSLKRMKMVFVKWLLPTSDSEIIFVSDILILVIYIRYSQISVLERTCIIEMTF